MLQECCYWQRWWDDFSFNQLITSPPYAGSSLAFNPLYASERANYLIEDRAAHDVCCLQASSLRYCALFYAQRPIGQCQRRFPFRFCKYVKGAMVCLDSLSERDEETET